VAVAVSAQRRQWQRQSSGGSGITAMA
jgi:hypothetical protein